MYGEWRYEENPDSFPIFEFVTCLKHHFILFRSVPKRIQTDLLLFQMHAVENDLETGQIGKRIITRKLRTYIEAFMEHLLFRN